MQKKQLRSQDEIIKNWPAEAPPLVSISCMTYNHEPYIRDAIEGFLIQETDFPFEILIHDDASTDKTADIVREYQEKYPRLIKAYYQTENSYGKPDRFERMAEFRSWSTGKYVASCEGDDYWTAPDKLQKQVEVMEANYNIAVCLHAGEKMSERGEPLGVLIQAKGDSDRYMSVGELICECGQNFPTASIMYRQNTIEEIPFFLHGRVSYVMLAATKGDIYCLNKPMSRYRVSAKGSFSGRYNSNKNFYKQHLFKMLRMFTEYDNYVNHKFRRSVNYQIKSRILRFFLQVDDGNLLSEQEKAQLMEYISFYEYPLFILNKLSPRLTKLVLGKYMSIRKRMAI